MLRWSPFPLFNCGTDVRAGPSTHAVLLGHGPLANPAGALVYAGALETDEAAQKLLLNPKKMPVKAHFALSPAEVAGTDDPLSGASKLMRSLRGGHAPSVSLRQDAGPDVSRNLSRRSTRPPLGGSVGGRGDRRTVSAFREPAARDGEARDPPQEERGQAPDVNGTGQPALGEVLVAEAAAPPTAPSNVSAVVPNEPAVGRSEHVGVGWRTAPVETPVDPLNDTGELVPVTVDQAPLMAHTRVSGRRALRTLAELPRAGRAILHEANFPPLVPPPPHGDVSEAPTGPGRLQPSLESRDVCQANEACFQFQAFAPATPAAGGAGVAAASPAAARLPEHVIVGFRFYKFPAFTSPRLRLGPGAAAGDAASLPRLLSRAHEATDRPLPGLDVRYMVDPAELGRGETGRFISFLDQKALLIDVWDGDTMMHIGTAELELRYLLRGGHRVIANTVELPVLKGQGSGGHRSQAGMPSHRGSLYVRIGNVGHVVPVPEGGLEQPAGCVVSVAAHNSTAVRAHKNKAARLAECDPELAMALNRAHPDPQNDEAARKARRLAAIRKRAGLEPTYGASLTGPDGNGTALPTVTVKLGVQGTARVDPVSRAQDLKTIEAYRARRKRDTIRQLLSEAITSSHTIRPSFGEAVYMEYPVRNPFHKDVALTVQLDDDQLQVVVDPEEWARLAAANKRQTPVESNMFEHRQGSMVLFLRAHEQVVVPLKYQSFDVGAVAPNELVPGSESSPTVAVHRQAADSSLPVRSIRLSLLAPDRRPVAVLNVVVEPRPHVVDRPFRFWNPQSSFFKEIIRIPAEGKPSVGNGQPQAGQFHVHCSDASVVCHTTAAEGNRPQDLSVKVACGPAPGVATFSLAIYRDAFKLVPAMIWQFFIHSVECVSMVRLLA